jgi:hypothetical protein
MAHYSELSGSIFISNITGSNAPLSTPISGCYVVRTLVVSNDHEDDGAEFLSSSLGLGGTWIKTSYNTRKGVHIGGGTPLRKNYADHNFIYDYNRDAFIPPMPTPPPLGSGSLVFSESQCWWYVEPSGSIYSGSID